MPVWGALECTYSFHGTRYAACRQVGREPNRFLLGGHGRALVVPQSARWVEGVFRRPLLSAKSLGMRILSHVKSGGMHGLFLFFIFWGGASRFDLRQTSPPGARPPSRNSGRCHGGVFRNSSRVPRALSVSRCSPCSARTDGCLLGDDRGGPVGIGDGDRVLAPVPCGGRGEVLEEFGNEVSFINLLPFL